MLVFIVKRQNNLRNNMVFLLLKDRKENLKMPTHKTAHLQATTQKPTLSKAKRAFILPTHQQTVDYSNTFYIEKRDIENYLLFLWLNYSEKMNRIKEVLEDKGLSQI